MKTFQTRNNNDKQEKKLCLTSQIPNSGGPGKSFLLFYYSKYCYTAIQFLNYVLNFSQCMLLISIMSIRPVQINSQQIGEQAGAHPSPLWMIYTTYDSHHENIYTSRKILKNECHLRQPNPPKASLVNVLTIHREYIISNILTFIFTSVLLYLHIMVQNPIITKTKTHTPRHVRTPCHTNYTHNKNAIRYEMDYNKLPFLTQNHPT